VSRGRQPVKGQCSLSLALEGRGVDEATWNKPLRRATCQGACAWRYSHSQTKCKQVYDPTLLSKALHEAPMSHTSLDCERPKVLRCVFCIHIETVRCGDQA
jgi:hypothetical protein